MSNAFLSHLGLPLLVFDFMVSKRPEFDEPGTDRRVPMLVSKTSFALTAEIRNIH
jgi:hypothetical protein